jgi:hypothetical protein
MHAFITVSISFFGQTHLYPRPQSQESGVFAVVRLIGLCDLSELLLNFFRFNACLIAFGISGLRPGADHRPSRNPLL